MLVVEDEPYLAEAIRDGLRLEAIAADIAGDGDAALELLRINAYDIAILDRDIPGPSGDDIAARIVNSGSWHADPYVDRSGPTRRQRVRVRTWAPTTTSPSPSSFES